MSWFLVLKCLLTVCIISHLSVSSTESYGCIRKTCFDGRCLPNTTSSCEFSKGCFSQLQEFAVPLLLLNQRIEQRGCSEDSCTELAFSATLGIDWMFSYNHQCCYSEQCNNKPINVSPLSLQPNGVECPTCYSELGTCRPVSLKCTGAQTTCVNVTGQGTREDSIKIHAMGCATQTACNLKNVIILNNIQIDTSCVTGSPPLRYSPSLSMDQKISSATAPILCLLAAVLPAIMVVESFSEL